MSNQLCRVCSHFRPSGDPNDKGKGECRRHPPVMGPSTPQGRWPVVQPAMWCGEFASKAAATTAKSTAVDEAIAAIAAGIGETLKLATAGVGTTMTAPADAIDEAPAEDASTPVE